MTETVQQLTVRLHVDDLDGIDALWGNTTSFAGYLVVGIGGVVGSHFDVRVKRITGDALPRDEVLAALRAAIADQAAGS